MINRFWSGLLTVLLLAGCGWDGTPTRPNDFAQLTSITISAVSATIANGTSAKLVATGHFSGQFDRDVTDRAVWSSASPAVADFRYSAAPNKNRVTAVTPGTTVVTATVDGVSATYVLTVSSATVQAVTITPATASIPVGMTTQFAATGSFSDATTQDLTFDAVWSSTPGTFATVSNISVSKGLASATAVGNESVVATFGAAPVSGTASLAVSAPAMQSITVSPANSTVSGLSKTVTFTATGNYSDGTTSDITGQATWASTKPGFATIVAGSGVATTVAAGTTSISATLNGISGSTNLTVTVPVLDTNGLQITPASPSMSVGATQQLTVMATYTDSSSKDVTSSCVWTSSAPSNASVSATGLVTGGIAGTTVITAAYGGQFTAVTVTVTVH
ncbi:MAG: Ig-like domain-containing protein [Desulfuromonadaceae bacterium]|nr:Ig-like domain-containing protein [Desulfuromonadaceae bacterium]